MLARRFRLPARALLLLPLLLSPPLASCAGTRTPVASRVAPATAQPTGVTTVIVVRHAERAAVPGGDPPISAAGEARALALRDALHDAGVTAIVTTQYRRTGQTAAPLAREAGLTAEQVVVDHEGDIARHAREVAELVATRHAGQTVLVVGHSNTVPAIVGALGVPGVAPISDEEFDRLYVVQLPATGSARLIRARFGAPTREVAP